MNEQSGAYTDSFQRVRVTNVETESGKGEESVKRELAKKRTGKEREYDWIRILLFSVSRGAGVGTGTKAESW